MVGHAGIMKQAHQLLFLAAVFGFSLSGCASADDRYPSLAVRDAERVQDTLEPALSDQPEVIGQSNLDALVAPVDRAQEAHAQFTAMEGQVRSLVFASRGIGPEDDRRAQALAGFAQLTSLRAKTALALSDLDLLELKAATGFKRTQEIREFQSTILKLIEQQDKTLDSLNEAMTR